VLNSAGYWVKINNKHRPTGGKYWIATGLGHFPDTCIVTSNDLGTSALETFYSNFIARQLYPTAAPLIWRWEGGECIGMWGVNTVKTQKCEIDVFFNVFIDSGHTQDLRPTRCVQKIKMCVTFLHWYRGHRVSAVFMCTRCRHAARRVISACLAARAIIDHASFELQVYRQFLLNVLLCLADLKTRLWNVPSFVQVIQFLWGRRHGSVKDKSCQFVVYLILK